MIKQEKSNLDNVKLLFSGYIRYDWLSMSTLCICHMCGLRIKANYFLYAKCGEGFIVNIMFLYICQVILLAN